MIEARVQGIIFILEKKKEKIVLFLLDFLLNYASSST